MPDAHTDRAGRRPRVLLAVAVVLLGVAVAVAWGAPGHLGVGSLRLADRPEQPSPADAELYVTLSGEAGLAPDEAAFRTSEDVVASQLRSDAVIGSVRSVTEGDQVVLVAGFGDVTNAEREEAVRRISSGIDAGALTAIVGGEAPRTLDAKEDLISELWRKELLALPLALLLLLGAAGGLRRAAGPVLCATLSIAGSLAALRLIGVFADVSLLGFASAAAVGLVLGVELPLRALAAADIPERDTRLAVGVAAAASFPGFGLLATALDQAASLALGAALAAALAIGATRLVVPPVALLSASTGAARSAERRAPRWPRLGRVAPILGLLALCGLVVPAVVYGATASYTVAPAADDSLFPELPAAAAITGVGLAAGFAWLARSPLGLPLAAVSLLPAGAALGVCAFLAEHGGAIGRDDVNGTFFDTGAAGVAACALVAISAARSAMTANAFSVGRRVELRPAVASTAVGLLAATGLFAVGIDAATDLSVALATGLCADLVLLRLPLAALLGRWIASRP